MLGSEPSIRGLTRADCVAWLEEQYRPERLVISAAGKVDPGHILLLAEALFGDLPRPRLRRPSRRRLRRRHALRPALGRADPSGLRFSRPSGLRSRGARLSLFAQAVGGGMSSRLFQELREERGLAYSIYAWTQGFADTGLFAVNLAADKARAAEAMTLAREMVERAAAELTEAELEPRPGAGRSGHADGAGNAAGARRLPWRARSRYSAGS